MHAKLLVTFGLALLPSAFASPIEQRACTGPAVNDATVALIKEFEGFVPKPEPDPIGLPTVGYGHLCKTKGCGEVPYPFPLTKETATKLMQSDLKSPQQAITMDTASSVVLNANQYGALVSWAFNVGNGNVASSTLIKRLNKGEAADKVIAEELPKWNKAGGKTLPGLTRRRKAEVDLAKTATTVKALPVEC
ncbi:glycoside hydrolase family 24 protein [Zopfia rhizophila CBS 207.26]|uniref:Glycoside hydrolase family 24 protein n=1 Tax=Zopfia rhizophila CBS 207.26 TaxID=1314779 RepID=A0A6A6DQ21_9PEZI|nr:glycoside hydrolase family 24 protein [Zopfia rhizophila CBS 207.26]